MHLTTYMYIYIYCYYDLIIIITFTSHQNSIEKGRKLFAKTYKNHLMINYYTVVNNIFLLSFKIFMQKIKLV